MYTSDRSTRFSTRPPAPSTSPGWATRNCTRPARGAVSEASARSASIRVMLASAAVTCDSMPTTWAAEASTAARAASTCALTAVSAASALRTRLRSSSSSCCEAAPSAASCVERARRRRAASRSLSRNCTCAWAARNSLSRSTTWACAVATACSVCARRATASARAASSVATSMRASTSPASTNAPSSTVTSARRPANLVATSISVASMRPLPCTKPGPGPWSRPAFQANQATMATTSRAAGANHRFTELFILFILA